ncbi:MAG: SDR family oxidoreductase [Gammaproteobacteria bacterium]|jgi:NAD(P)-dependent dehydrogenase (short-subunit alcohol dehydrogenase family)
MEFKDKVILVTGGSRGIGRAVARAFAARGGRLAVHYGHDEASARQTLSLLDGEGHAIFGADLAHPEACENLVENVVGSMGRLDVLVNNAAIYQTGSFEDMDYAQWQASWKQTLAVNLVGPANLSFLAARAMSAASGGRIVNISSRGAFRGEPTAVAYGASKAGLNAMTQSLAQALAPHNIFLGVVAPGFVETDMAKAILDGPAGPGIRAQSPLGRVAKPEEVARAVVFLASPGTEFSTGTIIDVNGASYLRS